MSAALSVLPLLRSLLCFSFLLPHPVLLLLLAATAGFLLLLVTTKELFLLLLCIHTAAGSDDIHEAHPQTGSDEQQRDDMRDLCSKARTRSELEGSDATKQTAM